ncbi:MAG: ATP-binding protein [Chloroflexota bacterium]|nr:ATP-binding protein [Chloroflexota bacterium]
MHSAAAKLSGLGETVTPMLEGLSRTLEHARGVVAVCITRLTRSSEHHAVEKEWLLWMINAVADPLVLTDASNNIILQNLPAERLLKSSPEQSEDKRRAIRMNNVVFTAALSKVRPGQPRSAQDSPRELVLTDPDTGEQLRVEVTSTEVRDGLGVTPATVSVMQDVSRLRELERRRIEQIMFESEKLAATGRLAASIAHEINNPLEAIKNSLYLLTNNIPAEDPNFKFLQIATRETDRVSRILRQMLGFYRPRRMAPTDINALIDEAEALIQEHLRQQRVRVEKDFDPDLPPVIASADQIKQVLLNLMLNARQAMPEGGVISVSTRLAHGADPEFLMADSVQIQVRDTGCGISEENVPRIFEPFFSTKDEKGTGLGLWVCQGIVQAHGGSMKLRSREGGGATVSVALPIGGPSRHGER